MKKQLAMLCAAFAMLLAGEAKAELFKCVKDGKTTYQEQPCAGQGAETKIQTARPSSWVGCYESKGSTMEGNRRQETSEVRQDGSTLYISTGKEGNEETRILLKPATTEQLQMFSQSIGLKGGDVQVTSGLVMVAASIGSRVTPANPKLPPLMGFYTIREAGTESLYLFGAVTFDKTTRIPCAGRK